MRNEYLGLAGLLGQAVADQCYLCSERFDSNGVLQTDNRFGDLIIWNEASVAFTGAEDVVKSPIITKCKMP